MLFCTFEFVVFFALVILLLKMVARWPVGQHLVLLVASNFFYGFWDWRFLGLIWISALLDFTIGILLERGYSRGKRQVLLYTSACGNLGILFFFKYFDFFQASTEQLLTALGISYSPWLLKTILPVGISFYTFQTMSYTIDVYRGKSPACRNILVFAQYVCYFPQLVAGPIERAAHLIPQLQATRVVNAEKIMSGGLLIVWGCLKKATIADSIGLLVVDNHFANPISGTHLMLAILAFGLQIYCDFSGYCDIARGASRCLGIELVENFNAPYFATSISDFWRRWHMTLSFWFRDYVYVNLGGNRQGLLRTTVNLWITMFLCGLWHGANLTFVAWGVYHGCLLMLHRLISGERRKANESWSDTPSRLTFMAKALATFGLVSYGWMIFRLEDASQIIPHSLMLLRPLEGFADPQLRWQCVGLTTLLALTGAGVWVAHWVQHQALNNGRELENLAHPTRLGLLLAGAMLVVVLFSSFGKGGVPFIYFQF